MGTADVENSMEFPQKIKKRTTTPFNNPIFGFLSEGNENTISKRYMHSNVHSSTIYNSQKMKATLSAHQQINGWRKCDVDNRPLLSHRK